MRTVLLEKPAFETLDGRVRRKVSPKTSHSLVQSAAGAIVRRCAAGRGAAGAEWRCRIAPGTSLVPDIAYVSYDRLRALPKSDRQVPPFAPDIAVEVRSPSNRAVYDAEKFAKYLAHGSLLVLDIDPAARAVYAHANDVGVRVYLSDDTFEHDAIPWLRFEINELFEDLDLI